MVEGLIRRMAMKAVACRQRDDTIHISHYATAISDC
jgi:hypothetical protein